MRDDLEALARILDRTGDYRILRRVPAPPVVTGTPAGLATAIILDTETTGLDPHDLVIELGMVRVAYDPADGRIIRVTGTISGLSDPGRPIPPLITRLTKLDDAAVAGRTIDPAEVAAFVAGAPIVVAHNASFNRSFAEHAWPVFAGPPWAGSLAQIDWAAERTEGARLTHLLAARGLFFDGHMRVGATAANGRGTALDATAARLRDDALVAAPTILSRHAQRIGRVLTDGLEGATRALRRHDDGAALLAVAGTAVSTALARQRASLDQALDRLLADATRLLDQAEHAAARHHLLVDGHDPQAILRRGYVLVTDRQGRALPTRVATAAQTDVVLQFDDGILDATIVA